MHPIYQPCGGVRGNIFYWVNRHYWDLSVFLCLELKQYSLLFFSRYSQSLPFMPPFHHRNVLEGVFKSECEVNFWGSAKTFKIKVKTQIKGSHELRQRCIFVSWKCSNLCMYSHAGFVTYLHVSPEQNVLCFLSEYTWGVNTQHMNCCWW